MKAPYDTCIIVKIYIHIFISKNAFPITRTIIDSVCAAAVVLSDPRSIAETKQFRCAHGREVRDSGAKWTAVSHFGSLTSRVPRKIGRKLFLLSVVPFRPLRSLVACRRTIRRGIWIKFPRDNAEVCEADS